MQRHAFHKVALQTPIATNLVCDHPCARAMLILKRMKMISVLVQGLDLQLKLYLWLMSLCSRCP
jgi:hypothetical protein